MKLVHVTRNKVNSAVDKAKGDFIRRKLKQNTKKKKKFWQSINTLIKDKIEIDISNITFRDLDSDQYVLKEDVPDFFNKYFAEIATRTRGSDANIDPNITHDIYPNNYKGFDLAPVDTETVLNCVEDIDVNMASCIEGITMKICKILTVNFAGKLAVLFSNSLFLGIFPR